jgi:hypothetical protein
MSRLSQSTANCIADDLLSSIATYCAPEDVFPQHALADWAVSNDYIKLNDVAKTYEPDDVFTYDQLSDWATSNGYALDCESR